MSLYTCSSCSDTIPLQKPRLHCTICRSHDICANCYVLSTYTSGHTADHITTLTRQSGTIPVQQLSSPPPLPPRPSSTNVPQVQHYSRPEVSWNPALQSQTTPQYSPAPQAQHYNRPEVGRKPVVEQRNNYPQFTPPLQAQQYGNPSLGRPVGEAQQQEPYFAPPPQSQPYASQSRPTSVAQQQIPYQMPSQSQPERPGSVKIPVTETQSQYLPPPQSQPPGGTAFTIPSSETKLEAPTYDSPHVQPLETPESGRNSVAESQHPAPQNQQPQPQQFADSSTNVTVGYAPSPQQMASPAPVPPQNSQRPQGWKPIFEGCNPSAIGLAFFNTVFDCLDTQKKGLLTPEQYSAFNDVQGYAIDEDVWKRSNKPTFGYNSEDLADYEFRTILENFSIDHDLQPRATTPNNDLGNMLGSIPNLPKDFAKLMSQETTLAPISGGKMPMLTRKGFIDITTLEVLGGPSLGWQRLNRIARHYQIWREWGDCPREMLPEEAPQEMLDRIKRVAAFSQRQAAERIEAKRVEMELKKQGREAALRLLDPPGTRYYYRY